MDRSTETSKINISPMRWFTRGLTYKQVQGIKKPHKQKTMKAQQAFLVCVFVTVLAFVYVALKDYRNSQTIAALKMFEIEEEIKVLEEKVGGAKKIDNIKDTHAKAEVKTTSEGKENLKYILQWTSPKSVPFVYMGVGQKGFIDRKCPYTNCFVTGDRNYLGDYTKFDVIAFLGPEVSHNWISGGLPQKRSPHQKYVFASIESADNYPVCYEKYNNFFNWTWTYKLDSEAKWGYVVVRDADMKLIGPKKIMHWMKEEDMDPVSDELREKLKSKTKAAAWFVSNCYSKSKREKYVENLKNELKKYGLNVDVYGKCGNLQCSRDKHDECLKMLSDNYYFYLSFENSFSDDYVTEKLIHPLQNNAIPIVYGGANYTRFMPDGIYLDAKELGAKKLAEKMNELMNDFDAYVDYFKWKKYYSFYRRFESLETDDYCSFCTILNNEEMVKKKSNYENFREWWNGPSKC